MRGKTIFGVALLAVSVGMFLPATQACPPPLTNNFCQQGDLLARTPQDSKLRSCEHQLTNLKILTSNLYTRIIVTEIFTNRFQEKIFAYYSLPLPENAVVESVFVKAGEQTIKSELSCPDDHEDFLEFIDDTQEIARRLHQNRPHEFTQFIANLATDQELEITVTYIEKSAAGWQQNTTMISGAEDFDDEVSQIGLFHRMNHSAILIVLTLFLMALYGLGAILYHSLAFFLARRQARHFVPRIFAVMRRHQLSEAIDLTRYYSASPVAKVMEAVLKVATSIPCSDHSLPELCGSARSRALVTSEAQSKKGLQRLKATGWLALLLGFLGTSINLHHTFRGAMSAEGAGWAVIAGGISESFTLALIGLLIALPALWAHRYLVTKARKIGRETDLATWELLAYLLKIRRDEQAINSYQTVIWSDA
ncbi:MAG: MotA/TolQ/ExbB proton channel family protein [Acidobacteria bacterium]|nr:MotA/TolQ/ExbB proton channel family protein [Acidobacteriota bacterium]